MENQNQPILPTSPILNKSSNTLPEDGLDDVIIKIPDNIIGVIKLSESPDAIYHYFIASPMYAGFGDLTSPERIQFLENMRIASPALKNYLTSSDTVELIFSVGRGYDLQDIQITELGVLVRKLLAGDIFLKEFPTTVSSKLGIDDVKAGDIVNKIISQSFGPILEDVKRIQRSKFPDKVMAMQKESRPEGLSPRPQISEEVKNMPLNKPREDNQQNTQSVRPPIAQLPPLQIDPTKPPSPPPPQTQQEPPNKPPVIQQPPIKPPLQMPPKPPEQPKSLDIPSSEQLLPKDGVSNTNQPLKQADSPQSAQKSLEEELAKVANIIDLRAKSEGN